MIDIFLKMPNYHVFQNNNERSMSLFRRIVYDFYLFGGWFPVAGKTFIPFTLAKGRIKNHRNVFLAKSLLNRRHNWHIITKLDTLSGFSIVALLK